MTLELLFENQLKQYPSLEEGEKIDKVFQTMKDQTLRKYKEAVDKIRKDPNLKPEEIHKKLVDLKNSYYGKLVRIAQTAHKHRKGLVVGGAVTTAVATSLYGLAKYRKHQLAKKDVEKNKVKESVGDTNMSTELILEFTLAEAMKNQGLTERVTPLSIFLKKRGKDLTMEEASTIVSILEAAELAAKKQILKKAISEIKEVNTIFEKEWVTSFDKNRNAQMKKGIRDERIAAIKKSAKDKAANVGKFIGQHKKAVAGAVVATAALGAGAKMLRNRQRRKAAEKAIENQ